MGLRASAGLPAISYWQDTESKFRNAQARGSGARSDLGSVITMEPNTIYQGFKAWFDEINSLHFDKDRQNLFKLPSLELVTSSNLKEALGKSFAGLELRERVRSPSPPPSPEISFSEFTFDCTECAFADTCHHRVRLVDEMELDDDEEMGPATLWH